MADDLHAIADLIGDAYDLAPIEVSDLLRTSPLVSLLLMEPSSNGSTHKYVKETGAPVVGFRAPNAGRDLDSSDDTLVSVNLKVLDYSWLVDQAVAMEWRRGGTVGYIAREGKRQLEAAFMTFERQVINGIIGASDSAFASGDSGGFAGFRDAATVDALSDAMVVNAAGTTADTVGSVWGIRLAEDGICGVYKGDGEAFYQGETVSQLYMPAPATNTKSFPGWYTPACTWLGLQVGSAYDIGRIANVTADSGKGLTDALVSTLLSKYPVGRAPTHLVMSRRSVMQLQKSRTATNPTGAPAPYPQESFGVPIIVSDACSDTEELLT